MKEVGTNKIHNVDCLEFINTLPDNCIDLVLTDPPYGMSYKSNYRKDKYESIENDSNIEWLPEIVEGCFRVLKDGTHAYFFCSFHNIEIFKSEIQKKFEFKNILVWMKNNTGMGDLDGDYAPQYEFCIYARKGSRKLNGSRDSNIIRYNKTGNNHHPTEKPVDLMAYLIKKSSNDGETVFDPFIGSGATAITCKMLNRKYIGCEISKKYCDTAIARVNNISNTLF
jgi:site-specific DNA-methyltransferase (adenine-specific)